MRFYKAWAHELYPKASFKEFTHRAHKICRDKRMRAALQGMHLKSVFYHIIHGLSIVIVIDMDSVEHCCLVKRWKMKFDRQMKNI